MESSIGHFPSSHVLIACLSLSFIILEPDINLEQLKKAVSDTSRWMANYLDDADANAIMGEEELANMELPSDEIN